MKRIVLLAPRDTVLVSGPQGGSSVVLLEDRRILEQDGWDVQIFGPTADHGVPVHTIPITTFTRRLSSLEYCGKFVRQNPRAVLLAYNEPTVAFLAPSRTIVRYDWHAPLPRYWRTMLALSRFRKATYLFPSHAARKLWCSHHSRIPPTKTRVIANGVDLNLFYPVRNPDNRFRVGFAGQWILEKGLDLLVGAWQEVRREVPRAELWVAGGPHLWKGTHPVPEERVLDVNKMRTTEIEGLNLVGVLPRDQMPGFWSQVDLACFPSVWEEPFGLATLEAMACGVPVVVSDAGALPEVVGDAGVIVPKSDERALTQTLIELLRSPERLKSIGLKSRLRATTFSLQQRVIELLRLVEEVADGISPKYTAD